jgi:phage terminase large subunit GpA-like protein
MSHITAPPRPLRFAEPGPIIYRALEAFLPSERISVAEYAARHRWLNNQGGGHVGRWRHEVTPYLVEPMEVLTSRAHLTTVVVGPARSGKTAIAENWLLQSVGADPATMLWYLSSDPSLKSYVKREINPMIELHREELKQRQGAMPADDSLSFKRFRGMSVEFLTAAYNNTINKSAPRIVADELDAYDPALGDAASLLDLRRQTFGQESMLLAVSHPDLAGGLDETKWTAGVMKLYAGSDRRLWWWPCPHCGAWSSPNPAASRVMVLDWPAEASLEEIEAEARLVCPTCGGLIEDRERAAMNRAGRWVGLGQAIDEDGTVSGELTPRKIAGFWIVGLMSPFIIGGIGALARALAEARREAEAGGDPRNLRDVTVKRLGVPYDSPRRVGSLDAATLAARAEPELALGQVPAGVRFLTAAADTQANRFEVLVRGWGRRGESWIIDALRIPADPAVSAEDWDRLFATLLGLAYPLADGSGRKMRVRGAGFDAYGAPGVTQLAYDAWRRWRARRGVVRLGRVDGRDVWSLMPMKGMPSLAAARLQVVYPDTARRDRRASAGGQVPLAQFAANAFKDDLAGQLARADAGPWAVHFPAALKSKEPPHAWFEQLVSETRRPSGAWAKTASAARNEALDLMVMTHAIAHLHGLARIDWDRPPGWAAEWNANGGVVRGGVVRRSEEAPNLPSGTSLEVVGKPKVSASLVARLV